MDEKPQLHVSMLNTMSRCGIQFQRRYGARFGIWHTEEIIPPSIALVTGISCHEAIEKNLTHKLDTGSLLPLLEAQEVARDSVTRATSMSEITLSEDEAKDVGGTISKTIDTAVKLVSLHHVEIAPEIEPEAIEKPFVIEMEHYPVDLGGKIDVVEVGGNIRDTKTAGRTPAPTAVKSLQMAMYSQAQKVLTGEFPEKVSLDFLVKTKKPKAVILEAIPHAGWIQPLFRRIERAVEIIDAVKDGKQALTPANPDDWACSGRYCGYSSTCPYFSGRP